MTEAAAVLVSRFWFWCFEFVSDFVLRISIIHLPRRPLQRPAAQNMQVQMIDRLPRIRPAIHDDAIAVLQPELLGDRRHDAATDAPAAG